MKELMDFIGKLEAPRGYDQMYGPAEQKLGRHKLTSMSLAQIRELQIRMAKASGSSAVGRPQFIRKTLDRLRAKLKLSGTTKFTPALQDMLMLELMEERGLSKYLAGEMSRAQFANNLAHEWASLPCIGGDEHGKSSPLAMKKSCYAGDGLNAARTSPETFLAVLDRIKGDDAPDHVPAPPTVPKPQEKPKGGPVAVGGGGIVAAILAWLSENQEILIAGLVVAIAATAGAIWWWRRK